LYTPGVIEYNIEILTHLPHIITK